MPEITTVDTPPAAAGTPSPNAPETAPLAGFATDEAGLFAPVYPLPRIELVSGLIAHASRVEES